MAGYQCSGQSIDCPYYPCSRNPDDRIIALARNLVCIQDSIHWEYNGNVYFCQKKNNNKLLREAGFLR